MSDQFVNQTFPLRTMGLPVNSLLSTFHIQTLILPIIMVDVLRDLSSDGGQMSRVASKIEDHHNLFFCPENLANSVVTMFADMLAP